MYAAYCNDIHGMPSSHRLYILIMNGARVIVFFLYMGNIFNIYRTNRFRCAVVEFTDFGKLTEVYKDSTGFQWNSIVI